MAAVPCNLPCKPCPTAPVPLDGAQWGEAVGVGHVDLRRGKLVLALAVTFLEVGSEGGKGGDD